MIAQARVVPRQARSPSSADPCSQLPATTPAISAATPSALISPIPSFVNRIPSPITTATGIEIRIVESPHGLSASAFTTTSASTARRMTMIARMAMSETTPAKCPTSSRIICPRDLARRRTEQKRIRQSWTAPPRVAPTRIHSRPGR
jgi:hypothetical protein